MSPKIAISKNISPMLLQGFQVPSKDDFLKRRALSVLNAENTDVSEEENIKCIKDIESGYLDLVTYIKDIDSFQSGNTFRIS